MKTIVAQPLKQPLRIGIVASRFNEEVVQALCEGALTRIKELGFSDDLVTVVWVPGAVEIPLTAQRLAKTNRYEAIIGLGAVIRGDTTHYDYVCEIVSRGCAKVALKCDIPVIFGVLTTENEEQAMERVGGAHGHKGKDAVDAAVQLMSVLRQLDSMMLD